MEQSTFSTSPRFPSSFRSGRIPNKKHSTAAVPQEFRLGQRVQRVTIPAEDGRELRLEPASSEALIGVAFFHLDTYRGRR
jgi:hypothetical protein